MLIERTNQLNSNSTFTPREENYLQEHSRLPLQIELVPKSSWLHNIRKAVTGSQWDRIRKIVYIKANFLCEICGEVGTQHKVECHEVWSYDDKSNTQKLTSLQSICPLCHEVKHIGRASLFGKHERAFNRFVKINSLREDDAVEIEHAVFKQWKLRSKRSWKLDVSYIQNFQIDPNSLKGMST